jgi:transaldolase
VIKVPSTAAGLVAARELTSRGIGVTITLTFSLFQALPFAAVLAQGSALVSYIAIMNGRLAFPVRDELKRGSIPRGVEAARWAGVEVARKTCRRLYASIRDGGLGVDPVRVKVMVASLRIYGDWIPDVSELWGVPLVTIFPNVRRAYDATPRPPPALALSGPTPAEELDVLLKSEIFRQAWWTESDGSRGRPDRLLTLDPVDAPAVSRWAPVRETLDQFIGTFDEMRSMVRERMRALA